MNFKKNKKILGVDIPLILKEQNLTESSLGSVPDFKVDEAVDLMVERISSIIKSHILQDKSRDPVERNEAINNAAIVLKEIKNDVSDLVKEKLYIYSRI